MSFEVTSYADLKKVGTGVDGWTLDADYIQTADIDASGSATENPDGSGGYYGFLPIGNDTNFFTGTYDGQGHTINNLYINRPSTDYVGLFGVISGEVNNLGIISANINGNLGIGILCGANIGNISNCYSTGNVSGNDVVGGFCGGSDYGNISNCYSTGSVSGNEDTGGFCGGDSHGNISNCYSTGSVSGNEDTGGFCGGSDESTIISCYWDKQTSGQSTSAGGTGLTTDEMTYEYADTAYIGWNFTNIWYADVLNQNDGYPMLKVFLSNYVLIFSASNISYDAAKLSGRVVIE